LNAAIQTLQSKENDMRRSGFLLAALVLIGISPAAWAHPGHLVGTGFGTGLLHPFTGLDHLLAMTAVGLLAARKGGRALFLVPASFIAMMTAGAIAAAAGLSLPLVEPGILGSVVVFGVLIALDARLPAGAGMAIVGVFAVFHGYAHALEMPAQASLAIFGSGMVVGTLVLHAIGVGLGRLTTRFSTVALQTVGAGIAAAGIGLLVAAA
jgi:urease accessory protein